MNGKGIKSKRLLLILISGFFAMQAANAAPAEMAPPLLDDPPGQRQDDPDPEPVPTALPPEPRQRASITLSPDPLHGAPPYTAVLHGSIYDGADCVTFQLNTGDGVALPLSCPSDETFQFTARHTYETAGTFYAQAAMTLNDGETVTSPTQTVVVARPQPVALPAQLSWWGVWLLAVGLAAAATLWCYRQTGRWRRWGLAGIGLLLITAVPPFSYLPDPLGILWGLGGGYVEDSRLPFANRFVMDDATRTLRPYLDGLIGQTGLDPLHSTQPLARYSFARVTLDLSGRTDVAVNFHYADGSQRQYAIPLSHPRAFVGAFYRRAWRYDGLARLRAEHRPLGDIPWSAQPPDPPRLLYTIQPDWVTRYGLFGYLDPPRLQWSPDGRSFFWLAPGDRSLWHASLAGEPRLVAQDVNTAVWSSDGKMHIFTRLSRDAQPTTTLYRARENEAPRVWLTVPDRIRPYAGPSGVWYAAGEQLWLASYDAGQAEPIRPLPSAAPGAPLHLSPDEQQVAYGCQTAEFGLLDLCLMGAAGTQRFELGARGMALAWHPDGQTLAVGYQRHQPVAELNEPAWVALIALNETGDGAMQRQIQVAPEGTVGSIAWRPGEKQLLVQTYPFSGRRMVLADLEAATAVDLSQPRWDAIVALHPDGKTLLLSNGRGGFWRSKLPPEPALYSISGGTSR
jgi:hypothetical protein